MSKRILDVVEAAVVIVMAAGAFYLVYPKYEILAPSAAYVVQINKITGQTYFSRASALKRKEPWLKIPNFQEDGVKEQTVTMEAVSPEKQKGLEHEFEIMDEPREK